jgi:hypothetical protein
MTLFDVETNSEGVVSRAIPIVPRDYVISPLNLGDIDAVELWVKQKTLDMFVESAKLIQGISSDEFLELVAKETRRVSELGWTADESMKLLSTVDGLAYIIHRSLSTEGGKQLSPEQLKLMLQCPENQMEALKAVKRLDSLDAWGVSHPTEAQSPGPEITTTKPTLTDVLLKVFSNIS